jgi:hypothetical protein
MIHITAQMRVLVAIAVCRWTQRDRFTCDWRERVKAPLSESDHDKLKDALRALAQPGENVPGRLVRPRVGSEKPMTLIKRR